MLSVSSKLLFCFFFFSLLASVFFMLENFLSLWWLLSSCSLDFLPMSVHWTAFPTTLPPWRTCCLWILNLFWGNLPPVHVLRLKFPPLCSVTTPSVFHLPKVCSKFSSINTSTIWFLKTKQNRNRLVNTENNWWLPDGRWVKGIKRYKLTVLK